MLVQNPAQAVELFKDADSAYQMARGELGRRDMVAMCYYEGAHWITRVEPGAFPALTSAGTQSPFVRLFPNFNPDVAKLRITRNRVARFVQKCAAATFPELIDADIAPPPRGATAANVYRNQVLEDALNSAIDESRLLYALRSANFHRCITGAWGLGLTVRRNQDTGSAFCEAFDFPATNLTLDPAQTNPDLHRHDYVIYSDIWTADKAERVLGVKLDRDKLSTVGQLSPLHQQLSQLTAGRLFSQYALYSRSKGVKVHQMHLRGDDGLYRTMYVLLEERPGDPQVINGDNPVSPYGGDGMPLCMLTGHPRGDKQGWIGDVAMLKDDQDALNLMYTMLTRQVYGAGSPKWVVDRRSFSPTNGKTPETFAQQFTSASNTLVEYDGGASRNSATNPPQLVVPPGPQPIYQSLIDSLEVEMREQVHRAEGNLGVTKSHVPNSTFQAAIDQADQVLGQRVKRDITQLEQLLPVLLGTTIRLAQEMSPAVIGTLSKDGLDEQDLGELLTLDPINLPCRITVRESSIRYRSHQAKRQDLLTFMQMQAIGPTEARRIMATDLDTAVTADDGYYATEAAKAAQRVEAGEDWQPTPLGKYGSFFIEAFRRASIGKKARLDPATRQRLIKAIISQHEADASEQALAAGAGIMAPQQGQPGAPSPESASLDELASRLDAQAQAL